MILKQEKIDHKEDTMHKFDEASWSTIKLES
jgi:hypothetical protein